MIASGHEGIEANGRVTEHGQKGRAVSAARGEDHVTPSRRALELIEL